MTPLSKRSIWLLALGACLVVLTVVGYSVQSYFLGRLHFLVLYRITFPFLERSVCQLRRLLLGDEPYRVRPDSCGSFDKLLSDIATPQRHADDPWVTASEIVARAHSKLHFQPRVLLLASTLESDTYLVNSLNGSAAGNAFFTNTAQCMTSSLEHSADLRFWLLSGYALANVGVIETVSGIHLIDTTETPSSLVEALDELSFVQPKRCRRKPVETVFLSHFHTDHTGGIGGAYTWNGKLNATSPKIVSHTETLRFLNEFLVTTPIAKYRRAVKQFGSSVFLSAPNDGRPLSISGGIGGRFKLQKSKEASGSQLAFPTHTWTGSEKTINVGSRSMTMLRCPGETEDQICFYLPSLRLFYISDNFYYAFPNIYPLRGGVFRSPTAWIGSLDSFLRNYSSRTDVLAGGHTSPVFGPALIRTLVIRYKDAIQFVYDQTIRLMNHKNDPNEIASDVAALFWKLTPRVTNLPYTKAPVNKAAALLADPIMPFYGQLQWASKAIFTHEMGWFNDDPKQINEHRLSAVQRQTKFALMVKEGLSIELAAVNALAKEDCQWALELTTMALSHLESARPERETRLCGWPDESDDSPEVSDDVQSVYAEWASEMCAAGGDESSSSVIQPEEDARSCQDIRAEGTNELHVARCLHREALWCLGRRELPASGRNWYLSEALSAKEKALEEVEADTVAKILRAAFLESMPDLETVVLSFPRRYEPGLLSWQDKPTTVFLHFSGTDNTEFQNVEMDEQGFDPVLPSEASNKTYELVARNGILAVRPIRDETDIDWFTRNETRFVSMAITWSGFRSLVLRTHSPITLLWTGDIVIPSEDSTVDGLPVSRLQRIKLMFDVCELLLSLEQR